MVLFVTNLYSNPLKDLTAKQTAVMSSVFHKAKEFNLEYTVTAIVWEESQFGRYRINISDPSCGIFHIMPKSLIGRVDMKNTSWNRSRLCERLFIDDDFSFSAALLELKYWENYWHSKKVTRVWSHMVASYNGGFHANINGSYVRKIKKKIKWLKALKE